MGVLRACALPRSRVTFFKSIQKFKNDDYGYGMLVLRTALSPESDEQYRLEINDGPIPMQTTVGRSPDQSSGPRSDKRTPTAGPARWARLHLLLCPQIANNDNGGRWPGGSSRLAAGDQRGGGGGGGRPRGQQWWERRRTGLRAACKRIWGKAAPAAAQKNTRVMLVLYSVIKACVISSRSASSCRCIIHTVAIELKLYKKVHLAFNHVELMYASY
ncbi:uncharacterized protein LOC100842674 [Brachypodium distachyon]|uniref:uncharacterized protein LOC100842674 n=1 Tax=Brachypodium distachyon TaxID=15368 RepID=UPI000D0D949D|nr:uncharacterized protein LOC100842674 [Brachypodium distachyon]|eukprot:XP_024310374.1 uncharacterized protein LOC100842674 [Brachypodium distachyon]